MEIELYSKLQNPIEAIDRIGQWFAASGMFGCTRKEQGMILAMACIVEKKSPLEVKRTYHLLDGELSMRSDAMLSAFRQRGGKHRVLSRTAEFASVELDREGDKQVFSFTWEEAKGEPFVYDKNGGFKKNWRTPRARMQMLWSRVISDGVRTLAPEIVSGVYTPEESADISHPDGTAPASPPTVFSTPESAPAAAPASSAPIDVQSSQSAPPPDDAPLATHPAIHQAKLSAPGRLSDETVAALESAIDGGNAADALSWLKAQGWVKLGLAELSVRRAQKILNNPSGFLDVVQKDLAAVRAAEASK